VNCEELMKLAERAGELSPCPTGHPPGSAGKILVMQLRASLAYGLFHPEDEERAAEVEDVERTTTYRRSLTKLGDLRGRIAGSRQKPMKRDSHD
jgi:hypothetical protein